MLKSFAIEQSKNTDRIFLFMKCEMRTIIIKKKWLKWNTDGKKNICMWCEYNMMMKCGAEGVDNLKRVGESQTLQLFSYYMFWVNNNLKFVINKKQKQNSSIEHSYWKSCLKWLKDETLILDIWWFDREDWMLNQQTKICIYNYADSTFLNDKKGWKVKFKFTHTTHIIFKWLSIK